MSEEKAKRRYLDRWDGFTPSKRLWVWSVLAASVLTVTVGFTFGGWVTGGSATVMANMAAREARMELAASECVQRFIAEEDAPQQLSALKELGTWQRIDFIKDGGWSKLGVETAIPGADDLCAKNLVAMERLPESGSVASQAVGG